MKKFFSKIFQKKKENKDLNRSEMAERVDRGTEKAVEEYGSVFKKLAEFDRT